MIPGYNSGGRPKPLGDEIMNAWESAWADYVEALDAYDADWSGPEFVIDIGRVGRRLRDAARALWALDSAFCARLGV